MPIWETVIRVADEIGASLIILGSRSLRSLLLGSVADQVVHQARQSVLIIPSPALADLRRELATQQPDATEPFKQDLVGPH